jgi:hypothetical protein
VEAKLPSICIVRQQLTGICWQCEASNMHPPQAKLLQVSFGCLCSAGNMPASWLYPAGRIPVTITTEALLLAVICTPLSGDAGKISLTHISVENCTTTAETDLILPYTVCNGPPGIMCGDEGFTCPTGMNPRDTFTKCPGPECTEGDCCTANPTCGSSYTCPASFSAKVASTECPGASCSDADCCTANPTCGSSITCPAGLAKKPETTVCAGASCNFADCCTATCGSSYTCPAGLDKKANTQTCAGTTCTNADCCQPVRSTLYQVYTSLANTGSLTAAPAFEGYTAADTL